MSEHRHDWKLVHKSNISTRFKNAYPDRQTIVDIINDPGDSSELWTCPDCGEDRHTFRSGAMQLLSAVEAKPKAKKGGH